MRKWLQDGFFGSELLVRHVGNNVQPFMSLDQIFGRAAAEPFAAEGTIEEIYFYKKNIDRAVKAVNSKSTVNRNGRNDETSSVRN